MVDPIEIVRDTHQDSNHQYEKNYKFFEGHEGCKGHDSHTIGGQHVDGAHEEGIGCDPKESGSLEDALSFGWGTGEDDDDSLQEEDLGVMGVTVE